MPVCPSSATKERRLWRGLAGVALVRSLIFASLLAIGGFFSAARADTAPVLPWTVTGPPAGEAHAPGEPLEFTVTVGSEDIRGFRVVAARLIEQSHRNRLFPGGFEVCFTAASGAATPDCASLDPPLPKTNSRSFVLRAKGQTPEAGHFSGPVVFASEGSPVGQTVNVEIYVSSTERQVIGILVVFLASLLGWLLTNWARNRYNRSQLLLPAAFAQQRLVTLSSTLENAPTNAQISITAANTLNKIKSLFTALSPDALQAQGYIPPQLPSPAAATPMRLADYQALITSTNQWITALETLVNTGMARALQLLGTAGVTDQAVQTAIRAIDALSANSTPPDSTTINTTVNGALNPLAAALRPVGGSVTTQSGVQTLTVQLAHTSLLIWLGVIVVTTLTGAAVVVYSNPGFGAVTDYIACAFFGLGLPTGAAMLQQTAQSVSTALGVSTR
jgi:hypothetical protein